MGAYPQSGHDAETASMLSRDIGPDLLGSHPWPARMGMLKIACWKYTPAPLAANGFAKQPSSMSCTLADALSKVSEAEKASSFG